MTSLHHRKSSWFLLFKFTIKYIVRKITCMRLFWLDVITKESISTSKFVIVDATAYRLSSRKLTPRANVQPTKLDKQQNNLPKYGLYFLFWNPQVMHETSIVTPCLFKADFEAIRAMTAFQKKRLLFSEPI